MEVHAHTHSPDPDSHRGRKKLTHYFWEFLMLFLAVFCGFLAENQREHMIEKERAKQYILSFYEDLKRDSVNLARIIAVDIAKVEVLSDIFKCYDTVRKNWKATSCLVPIIKNSRFNSSVTFSYGTLQQLKNAGGYRLLDKEDRDSIMSYDNRTQGYKDYESTVFQETQDMVRSTLSMLGDFMANKFLYPGLAGPDSSQAELPLLFSDDKVLLNKYFNDIFRYRAVTQGQIGQLGNLMTKASVIIEYLNKKYHLK